MSSLPPRTIGLDISDKKTHVTVLSPDGEIEVQCVVVTSPEALGGFLQGQTPSRVVLEVSTHSRWIGPLVEAAGHEALLANPRKLKLIFASVDKCDEKDSERLARLGRLDPRLLSPVHRRSDAARDGLVHLRVRDTLVRQRTQLVNTVRALSKTYAVQLRRCTTAAFHRVAREELPEDLQNLMAPLIDTVEHLSGRIRECDGLIEDLCREVYPETQIVRQV